jgi:hypothetical protein
MHFCSHTENRWQKHKSLFRDGMAKHKDLSCYAGELQPQLFSSYFKFALVRNPWDRILSDYNFQNKKNAPSNEELFDLDDRGRTRSFREWLDAAFSNPFYYESGQWGAETKAAT